MLRWSDLQRALRDDSFALSTSNVISRRTALATLATTFPLASLSSGDDTHAKKKRKRKRKKRKKKDKPPENNAFGCLDVGQACSGDDTRCCSGICDGTKPKKGKKDTSRCVAHNVNVCEAAFDLCLGIEVRCGLQGACVKTTGDAPFCAGGTGECRVCQRDSDCVNQGFGVNAACVVCDVACASLSGGTICFSAAG